MSEHLPECPCQCTCGGVMFWEQDGTGTPTHTPSCAHWSSCICPVLRACEQRVRDEERGGAPVAAIELAGYSRGYAAALDAAREAVAALPPSPL